VWTPPVHVHFCNAKKTYPPEKTPANPKKHIHWRPV